LEAVDKLSNFGTVHFEAASFNEGLVTNQDTVKFIAIDKAGGRRQRSPISISAQDMGAALTSSGFGHKREYRTGRLLYLRLLDPSQVAWE
jgi:hypothetical protein